MRTFLLIFALWALTVGESFAGTPGAVTGIRHGTTDDHTRIVLDVSAKLSYEIRRFDNPQRIAINLHQARAGNEVGRFDIADGAVHRVRVNHLSWGTQVVLD